MKRFLLLVMLGFGSAVPPPARTKLVFAHYMLCFSAFGANSTGYQREIGIAQDNGLDGFAVEYLGRDPYYLPNAIAIFEACEAYNAANPTKPPFLLFVIINFCCGLNLTDAVSLYARFYNSSCLFRPDLEVPARGAFSSWSAIDWHGSINASAWDSEFFAPIAAQGLARPYFMPFIYPPNYDVPPTLADQETILQQVPSLDVLWYWGCSDLGDQVVNSSLWNVQACAGAGKRSANPFSGPYSPHLKGNNRYFPSRGGQALMDTWQAHIDAQPDFVIATTWNDLGEHHYIGPYTYSIWGPLGIVTTNAFPHLAYLELSSYFIRWYKAPRGSPAPTITPGDERLFYFYNLQPVANPCPGDAVGPPQLNADARYPIEDAAYATLLLATPANVTIASGDGSPGVTFEVAAGLHQVQAPALPGSQRFVVSRGGAVLVDVTGGERVNASEAVTDLCNAQTYTGSAWLSGAAERG